MVQPTSDGASYRRALSYLTALIAMSAVCGAALRTSHAQATSPRSLYNEGSATDWTNFPTQPQNLTFASGLQGWDTIAFFGERLSRGSGEYETAIDPNVQRSGTPCPALTARVDHPKTTAILQQAVRADEFRGKRIRFSAYLKTEGAADGAALWLRQDTPNWQKAWNRWDNPIRGTTDWKEYSYVLDVAPDAQGIDFGAGLQGRGRIWIDAVKFEEVGKEIPVTEPDFDSSEAGYFHSLPRRPRNLAFAQGMEGWGKSANGTDGDPNPFYGVGVDPQVHHEGAACAYLESTVSRPRGYGALRQDIAAHDYAGKRIRFSASLMTQGIEHYTGLMICLVEPSGTRVWAMQKRPIRGTTDWKRYEYVVDVPEDTRAILFGLSIQGRGKVWASGFEFEPVDKNVPVTAEAPETLKDF
jgi:hypothetical protein